MYAWLISLRRLGLCTLALLALCISLGAHATPTVRAAITPVFANSASVTISSPTSTVVGDLLIAQIAVSSGATITTPVGWTLLVNTANGSSLRQAIYWRLAAVAGANSFSWVLSASGRNGGAMLAISAGTFDSSMPIDNGAIASSGSSASPNTAALSVLTADSLVLAAFGSNRGNQSTALVAGNPGTVVHDDQGGTGNGPALLLTRASQASAGNYSPINATAFNSNDDWVAQAWAIRPPSIAPVLSWRFDEAAWTGLAGEVIDSSGNNLNGTVKPATANRPTTAAANPALATNSAGEGTCRYGSFNSANRQYAEVADSNLLDLSSFTVAVWVYPRSWPGSDLMTIVSKDVNFEFHLKPTGVVNWWWRDSAGTRQFDSTNNTAGRVAINAWTHVAIRFRPGSQTLFINGVANASASNALAPLSNSDPLQVGADLNARHFNGNLDELRVFAGALSDAQVLALASERHACSGAVPHHLEFLHDGTALTCQPEAVTLRACADASCATLYTADVSATLTPSGWVGGDTQVVSNGTANLKLRRNSAEVVTLGVSSASPTPSNPALCYIGVSANCSLDFKDAGFIFDVPNLLADKPSGSIDLIAARKDDTTQRCVPAFAPGTRTVQFWSGYSNPASGTQSVSVNSAPVSGSSPGTSLSLNFDSNARASIDVRYADAGQMNLNASYTGSAASGDAGLLLTGNDTFVTKPYGLLLQTDTSSSCTLADISCPLYPGSVRAGDAFNLKIKAVAWQSDGEPLTAAALANNPATPNFQLSNIALSSQLLAPAGGSAGALGVGNYSHVLGTVANSNSTTVSQTISEVGVFSLTATPPLTGYFGETVSTSVSGNIGRFAPAYLTASGRASLTPSCGAAFSYQGQPMAFAVGQEPLLTVTGKNRSGVVTSNYDRGDFWRLGIPTRDPYLSVTAKASLDAVGRLISSTPVSPVQSGADTGDGARSYLWSGETLQYNPAVLPLAEDVPFTAAVRQDFTAAALTDADAVCNGLGSGCLAFGYDFANLPGSEVRLGRVRLSNANGSELQGLALPFNLETWQAVAGASFQPELTDSCTNATVLGAPVLSAYTGNLAAGETLATVSGPLAGGGQLRLSAPGSGNDGSVQAGFATLPTWLYYDWDATGVASGRRAASGLASFGIYRGATPLIFRRELYR